VHTAKETKQKTEAKKKKKNFQKTPSCSFHKSTLKYSTEALTAKQKGDIPVQKSTARILNPMSLGTAENISETACFSEF
jgi:hypothetical protein